MSYISVGNTHTHHFTVHGNAIPTLLQSFWDLILTLQALHGSPWVIMTPHLMYYATPKDYQRHTRCINVHRMASERNQLVRMCCLHHKSMPISIITMYKDYRNIPPINLCRKTAIRMDTFFYNSCHHTSGVLHRR